MGRFFRTAVAACAGAVGAAGCGAPAATVELTAQPRAAAAVAVEPTDGRLGDATAIRAGGSIRELSRGGRVILRPRADAPRRDGVGAGAACPAAAPDSLPAMTEATLCLLNGERADHGLAPLRANGKLAAAATAYAADLVAGSYFSHTARDGSGLRERIARTGYLPRGADWVLGENLAWGTGALATPGSIMQGWMNSPGHRENVLNPDYREVGIGVVAGNPAAADGLGATYATEFGAIERVDARPAAAGQRRAVASRRQRTRAARHARARAARLAGGQAHGQVGRVTARLAT
jgi:uncharacterized protein YkwD